SAPSFGHQRMGSGSAFPLPRSPEAQNAERQKNSVACCCCCGSILAVLASLPHIVCSHNRIVVRQQLGSAFPFAVRSSTSAGTTANGNAEPNCCLKIGRAHV